MDTRTAAVDARIDDLRQTGESIRLERRAAAADGRPSVATRLRLILGRRLVVLGNSLLEGPHRSQAVAGGR